MTVCGQSAARGQKKPWWRETADQGSSPHILKNLRIERSIKLLAEKILELVGNSVNLIKVQLGLKL